MQMHQLRYASCSSWGMQAAAPEVCKWLPLRYAEVCKLLRKRCASCTSRDMQVAPAVICMQMQRRYASCVSWAIRAALAEVCKLHQPRYARSSNAGIYKLLSRCLQAASWGMKAAPIAVEACKLLQVKYTSCSWDTQATLAMVLL
jgi:hypothetical protein